MKSRIFMLVTAILVTAALAVPIRLLSQNQTTHFRHYKLIDIGTLGGPESFIVSPENSRPTLNSRGMGVGGSGTSVSTTAQSDPFVCGGIASLLPNVNHAFEWRQGVVTDLQALSPAEENCSVATSVNANGEIVGISENGVLDHVLGFNELRAVLWKDGQILDLGTFGGNHSIVGPINNKGQVAGETLNDVPDPFSLFDLTIFGSPRGTQTRAFVWQNGVMQDLGTLGGPDAGAGFGWGFINDDGQVAGFSYTNSMPNPATGFPTLDPFLWTNGEMRDLGSLGGFVGFSVGINNRGMVIGGSSLAAEPGACFVAATASFEFLGSTNCHPFLWDHGKLLDLNTSTTGGSPLTVNAINDAGEIVGGADFSSTGGSSFDAYLWRNGIATDLGNLGDCASKGSNLNSLGQVVGQTFLCDGTFSRAYLWEKGSIVDLNTLIPAGSSLHLLWAQAINDRGEISGIGVPPNCTPGDMDICGHAFVLIPICADGTEGCADAPLDPAVVQASAASLTRPTASSANAFRVTATQSMSRYRSTVMMMRRNLRGGIMPPKSLASNTTLTSAPIVTLSPTSLTFSMQAIGTTSGAKTVALKNTGTASLTIASIAIAGTDAGEFAQTHTCTTSLAAGASCTIGIHFTPKAVGTRTAVLKISDNAAGSPQSVSLSGIAVTATTATLTPRSMSFDCVNRLVGSGCTPPEVATLTNTGGSSLYILNIFIGNLSPPKECFTGRCFPWIISQKNNCPSILPSGQACTITVSFGGPAFRIPIKKTFTGMLFVQDTATGNPQEMSLVGTTFGVP